MPQITDCIKHRHLTLLIQLLHHRVQGNKSSSSTNACEWEIKEVVEDVRSFVKKR